MCDVLKLLMTTITPHAFCPVDYNILALYCTARYLYLSDLAYLLPPQCMFNTSG